MFIPRHYIIDDPKTVLDFVKANGFSSIISVSEGQPVITHIPLYVQEESPLKLQGHIARANPHATVLGLEEDITVTIMGAHAYVSSSWYPFDNAGTWNYMAVHMRGKVRLLDESEYVDHLSLLTSKYEKGQEQPKLVPDFNPEYVSRMVKGIVAFEIEVTEIECKFKLSQNKTGDVAKDVQNQLAKSDDPLAREIARQMGNHHPKL